jgi:hypothetical protein
MTLEQQDTQMQKMKLDHYFIAYIKENKNESKLRVENIKFLKESIGESSCH